MIRKSAFTWKSLPSSLKIIDFINATVAHQYSPILNSKTKRQFASDAAAIPNITEPYKNARPFENIPKLQGLRSLPYIGPMFLFKPFSKYMYISVLFLDCD